MASFLCSIRFTLVALLFWGVTISNNRPSATALLDHLQGPWTMRGTVRNKPVKYAADGAWILQNQFFSLHMLDASIPPKYEADLFIGIDTSKRQYVAHWLDSFGGAGARVVATGPLSTEKIEIIFPYPEGRFRNLFTYDSGNNEWKLVIESEQSGDHWSPFADYTFTKK